LTTQKNPFKSTTHLQHPIIEHDPALLVKLGEVQQAVLRSFNKVSDCSYGLGDKGRAPNTLGYPIFYASDRIARSAIIYIRYIKKSSVILVGLIKYIAWHIFAHDGRLRHETA
jgi:hypothetical protein